MSKPASLISRILPTSLDWWCSASGIRLCLAVNVIVAIGVDYLVIKVCFGI